MSVNKLADVILVLMIIAALFVAAPAIWRWLLLLPPGF